MKYSHRFLAKALSLALIGSLWLLPLTVHATEAEEQAELERQAAYAKTIDSNQIENWPDGPQIYAESAIVNGFLDMIHDATH